MQLFWLKGPYTWIAKVTESNDSANSIFQRAIPPENSALVDLAIRLLEVGGTAAVFPFAEERLVPFIVKNGQVNSFARIKMKTARQSECHTNSAKLWARNVKKYRLVTGYALSPDGKWRSHSWVTEQNDIILETTEKRSVYFGVVLSDEQADSFYKMNIGKERK